MNFLAHLYLSGNDHDVMVGNFIGDFVRGRAAKEMLGPGVVRGIDLHRAIHAFTDRHVVVKHSKSRLWPKYRHYAAVIVDIYYDHYLAALWDHYSEEPLTAFASRSYQLLLDREPLLPDRVRHLLPHMVRGNWLLNYASVDGIHRALGAVSQRATFASRMDESVEDLKASYVSFESEFRSFFPELVSFVRSWLTSH